MQNNCACMLYFFSVLLSRQTFTCGLLFYRVIERHDSVPETIVAVFPPSDLLTSGNHHADESQFYQASSDSTISSIKCVMSTILFLAVVTIIIVVAFVKNPGM